MSNVVLLEISIVPYEPYQQYKYSIHAEQSCINKCKNKKILKYCILILIKLTNNGKIKNCEPCHMCFHIIKKYKVFKVIVIN